MEERIYDPQFFEKDFLRGKSGIYQIRNLLNNKIYIGSAKDLFIRHKQHFQLFLLGKHHNKHLQNVYNKYGKDIFIFEIIEFCAPEIRFDIEQYWVDKFYGNDCYNKNRKTLAPPDNTGKNLPERSKAYKLKMSNLKKQQCKSDPSIIQHLNILRKEKGKASGGGHACAKKIVCLETKEIFSCMKDACIKYNISHSSILRCCKRINDSIINKFHWLYKEDYDKLSEQEILNIIYDHKNSKSVACLETNKIYHSILQASQESKCPKEGILQCCLNKRKETKGFHWSFYEDYKKMSEEEINNKLKQHNRNHHKYKCIETGQLFNTLQEAANAFNVNYNHIAKCCKGQCKSVRGYHFEYVD